MMNFDELKKIYTEEFDLAKYLDERKNNIRSYNKTIEDLINNIHMLDEREEIYKTYYLLNSNRADQIKFLESLPITTLLKYGMQFPEYGLIVVTNDYAENLSFTSQHNYDIMITKHPNYSPVIEHAHDFYEAVYVLEGKLSHTVEKHLLQMHTGDLCLISPHSKHYLKVFDDSSVIINILIRRSTFSDIFFNLLRGNNILSFYFLSTIYSDNPSSYILFHTGTDIFLKKMILDMMLEFNNKQKYFSEILNSSLITFFANLLRQYGSSYELEPTIDEKEMRPYRLIGYIQDNYKAATLHDLADHFHFSEEYASRLIKKLTGRNYTALLLEIRMKRAAELLMTTTITISELCEEIGYLNPEHLIRTFKKYYGLTPTQFRSRKTNYPIS